MKKQLMVILLIALFAVVSFAGDHAYLKINKCKMCHKGTKGNMIFEKWSEGPHAKAFATLAGEKSLEVYAKLGKTGNPQEDAECLKCHVTGFGEDAALTADLDPANGVECQACHGAGGDYWKKTVMMDHDLAVTNGLIANPKEGCVKCHNEESPTFKGFNVEERWAEIAHEKAVKAETMKADGAAKAGTAEKAKTAKSKTSGQ